MYIHVYSSNGATNYNTSTKRYFRDKLYIYTLTSEAADNILETWDNIGAEGSKITAKLYNTKTLYINGTGKIKDNINWYKNNLHYELLFKNIIINKGIDDIGKKAFNGCLNLKSVQASYVENIGESAFERMYKARNNYYE